MQLGARHLETCCNRSSGRHQDGVVTLRPESLEVLHPRAGGDLDTESRDIADVLVDDLFGQAINRYCLAEESAGLWRCFQDLHAVPRTRQLPGSCQSGGAGPHDGHAFAVRLRDRDAGTVDLAIVQFRNKSLQPTDGESPLQITACAIALAGGVAGAPERPDERRRVENQLKGFLELPASDERDVAVGLDPGRAGVRTWRGADTLDDRLFRHGLGKGNVSGARGTRSALN